MNAQLRPYLNNPGEWEAAKDRMDQYRDTHRDRIAIAGQAWEAGFRAYQIAIFMGIQTGTAEGWVKEYRDAKTA
jgi:hypothetical protein